MPHLIPQHRVMATPLPQPYLPLGTGVIHYSNITHTCQIARLHGGKWCNRPAWKSSALMVALAGIGNGIAQFWWTRSLSLAPPSAVVPFNYLSLVWATILGFAVWGDVPTPGLLVGSAIVVASGLYILWRETVRRRPAVPTPQRA